MKKYLIIFASLCMLALACTHNGDDKQFIREMYEQSLYEDYDFLKLHCSSSLLAKLADEYDYDGAGYAVWLFRSAAQDGPSDQHALVGIDAEDDGWYCYTAVDMGITFTRRIRIVHEDGIIVIDDLE